MKIFPSRLFLTIASVALFFFVSSGEGIAQFDTATVLGSVHDASKAAVPGVTVTISNLDKGISVSRTTDGEGNYEFPSLAIGHYRISAEKQGFQIATIDDVVVTVNGRQRVDLSLQVGSVKTEVTINAQTVLVESESSERGQVIANREI